MNSQVKVRLEDTLQKYQISKNKASRDMGYSQSILSAYTTGNYAGNISALEESIIKWCNRQDQAHSRKKVPLVMTTALVSITKAIELAHTEGDIALITADAGSGKTTAAKKYANENLNVAVYIPVFAGMNRIMLVKEVARQLNIETNRVPFNSLVQIVSDTLAERNSIVLIDEADYLKADALEFVRRFVYDLGNSGLVLIGLPKLKGMIQNMHQDHRQLESRIGISLTIEGLTMQDAKTIATAVWPNCSSDVIKSLFSVSKNDTRQFCKLIERMQNTMVLNKMEEPTVDVVEMASDLVLRRR